MTVPDRFKQIKFVTQEHGHDRGTLAAEVEIEDSEELLNQPGATYPLPPFYKRLFNGMDPVIPEARSSRCMPNVSATTRSAPAPESLASPVRWSNAFDRKPCAAQAVAQGFPSLLDADRMRLQHPARHGLVGRRGLTQPKTNASRSRNAALPPAPSARSPSSNSAAARHAGRILYDILRAIARLDGTGIVAAQEANGAVIAPIRDRRAPAKARATRSARSGPARSIRRKPQ